MEDINNLSRIEEQITRFVSTNKRRNWGDAGHGWETLTDAGTDALSKTIAVNGSKKNIGDPSAAVSSSVDAICRCSGELRKVLLSSLSVQI